MEMVNGGRETTEPCGGVWEVGGGKGNVLNATFSEEMDKSVNTIKIASQSPFLIS